MVTVLEVSVLLVTGLDLLLQAIKHSSIPSLEVCIKPVQLLAVPLQLLVIEAAELCLELSWLQSRHLLVPEVQRLWRGREEIVPSQDLIPLLDQPPVLGAPGGCPPTEAAHHIAVRVFRGLRPGATGPGHSCLRL